jgi:hypothetical protein
MDERNNFLWGNMHSILCIKTPPRSGILGRKGTERGEESIFLVACLVEAANKDS